jgi:two-component system, OmpR family, phosphate regulon sensor histidine kinase PhoR
MRIQRRLTYLLLAVVAGAIVPVAMLVHRAVAADTRELLREGLAHRTALLAGELGRAPPPDLAAWVAQVHTAAAARVTVLGDRGAILADSDVPPAPAPLDNTSAPRALAPEVAAALAGRGGFDVRDDGSGETLYVAAPVFHAPEAPGAEIQAMRLGLSLERVRGVVADAHSAIFLAAVIAIAIALGIGSAAARWLGRPLLALTRVARAMSHEDFDARLPPPSDDELGDLVMTLDTLRGQLASHIDELRREGEKLRTILDGMTEGVALIQDGAITAANPAFRALLGLGERIEGRPLLEITRLPELTDAVEDPAGPERELRRRGRSLRVQAHRLGEAAAGQVVLVISDVTQARRTERLRRDFVANASHELRTPVAAIVGATETLRAGAADDPSARASFLDILDRHAQRLARLTTDLLDLARIEGGYQPRVESVPVAAAVEAVVAALDERARAKSITVEVRGAGELAVAAERAAVEQIVTNFVDNAIKYTPERGRVTVTVTARDGGRIEIAVEDTGPGIATEHLARIFERFYRVDNARSRELGGTGLGLAIVRHLALANGGDVSVQSTVGAGSRFAVSLPRAQVFANNSQTPAETELK